MHLTIRKYLLLFSGLVLFSQAESQFTGEWLAAELDYDLPKSFSLEGSLEARGMNEKGFVLSKYFAQAGVNYKINKHFDLSLSYRYSWRIEDNRHYYPRRRVIFDLKFDYPLELFKFDYRGRYQRITKTYIDSEFDLVPTSVFRNKLEVSYNIPHNPMTPSLGIEFFSPLNSFEPGVINETRISADLEYPLNKKNSIKGGLLITHERFDTPVSVFILQFSYKYSIN